MVNFFYVWVECYTYGRILRRGHIFFRHSKYLEVNETIGKIKVTLVAGEILKTRYQAMFRQKMLSELGFISYVFVNTAEYDVKISCEYSNKIKKSIVCGSWCSVTYWVSLFILKCTKGFILGARFVGLNTDTVLS